MTPCFTALYYAAAAALFSYMADGGPRVEYPPCCLVEVGGIDGGRESIDFVSKDSPHEARRNVALTPQIYDNRLGGTNPVTRLGNLTGEALLPGNLIQPLPSGTEAYADMIAVIDGAEHSVGLLGDYLTGKD